MRVIENFIKNFPFSILIQYLSKIKVKVENQTNFPKITLMDYWKRGELPRSTNQNRRGWKHIYKNEEGFLFQKFQTWINNTTNKILYTLGAVLMYESLDTERNWYEETRGFWAVNIPENAEE